MAKKFLEQIADYYTDRQRVDNLPLTTFIFPNKRSSRFLRHYILPRLSGDYLLPPRFTTFQRFAAATSKMTEASRFELLFMLFNAYTEVLSEKNPEAARAAQFDKFIFWGDMILDDFDLIDSSLADAEKVYRNLKEFKDIRSDYLTDEQKEVIEHIWGPTSLTQHIDRFWHHIRHDSKGDESLANNFVALWEVLGPVYRLFREKLAEAGKATPGMQLRKTVDIIKATRKERLCYRRYVFVGFADLNNAEIAIMSRLRNAGCADFFWDLASPMFHDGDKPESSNLAVRFISKIAERFPMPDDFELDEIDIDQKIEIIGTPSSVMQTKIAGDIISKLELKKESSFNTAIVVPDPTQLMSLMLSLPKNDHGINITIGLPYSSTTFSTLFSAIIMMQRRSRKSRNNGRIFFTQDVLEVLIHPHLQLIAPTEANILRQYIFDRDLFNIEANKIVNHFPALAFIFKPINNEGGAEYLGDINSTCDYIEGLIKGLINALSVHAGYKNSFEMEILEYFEKEVVNLKDLVIKYSIVMKETTFISLFERVMMSKMINMEGTPLEGLQVMGVLETRCLDFDNIIFLAMNERSLPRREYVRTMIPNNLRRGYGLPSIEQTESFYSYYFFRAISRAKKATLLYDTRPPAKSRGEISRYLEQLIYLRSDKVTHSIVEISGSIPDKREIEVKKTDDVMKKLNRFKDPGSPFRISASSLKRYMNCPLQFYLQNVNGLGDENNPTEYIDAAQLGDIFHHSAKNIYYPYINKSITADIIEGILAGDTIEKTLFSEIASMTGLDPDKSTVADLNGESLLLYTHNRTELRTMLEYERDEYCKDGRSFTYVGGEVDYKKQWKVGDHTFNFRMQIDRIDRIGPNMLRFIDYKTGTDDTNAGDSMEKLFYGDHTKSAIFQLLTYAAAYQAFEGEKDDISIKLYTLRDLMKSGKIDEIKYKKEDIPPFSVLKAEFMALFEKLINEIFDINTPFTQCTDVSHCKYCPFISICGRNLPPEKYKKS